MTQCWSKAAAALCHSVELAQGLWCSLRELPCAVAAAGTRISPQVKPDGGGKGDLRQRRDAPLTFDRIPLAGPPDQRGSCKCHTWLALVEGDTRPQSNTGYCFLLLYSQGPEKEAQRA